MKVLIATNPKMGNPYTRTLIERVNDVDKGVDVSIDTSVFWKSEAEDYDIIHIMFPHELLLCQPRHTSAELAARFAELHAKGVKIVTTCHNFTPHYVDDPDINEAYAQTYANSDMIVHLAEYSRSIFASKYPSSRNVLLLHHVYDNIYSNKISKDSARKRLGLSAASKYVLCFGIIRDEEERALIRNLAEDLPDGFIVWAPSFYRVNKSRNFIKYGFNLAKYIYNKLSNSNISMQHQYVSHEDLPLYFSAADAVLIPRKKILNSGNLPMAFYFGKPVAGPNVGNVGQILNDTANFAFNPDDRSDIAEKVMMAVMSPDTGTENRKFAEKYMASQVIASQLIKLYSSLINK